MTADGRPAFAPKRLRTPLVSVVMTAYNEAHVIREAIDTLLVQTYPRMEVIVVDNGSTDSTPDIVRAYRSRIRSLRLSRNAGPGGGRNAGARVAKGEILVFIDADMVFDKRYISGLVAPVVAGKAIGAFHDREIVKNRHRIWARSFSINRVEQPAKTSGVFRAVLRKPFLAIGGFDTSRGYFDDDLSALGVSVRAHAMCYHNNPERLGEILRHSRWVGRSLIQDPVKRRFTMLAVVGSWAYLALVAVMAPLRPIISASSVVVAVAILAAFLLHKGLTRAIRDGYPEFLITVPVVWIVRLCGYWLGASAQILRGVRARA